MQRENGKGRKSSPMVERAEREEGPTHMCQVSKCGTRGKNHLDSTQKPSTKCKKKTLVPFHLFLLGSSTVIIFNDRARVLYSDREPSKRTISQPPHFTFSNNNNPPPSTEPPHTTYLLASRRHLTRKAKNLTQERGWGLSIASNECKFTSRVPVALIRGGRCYGHASKPQPSLFSLSPPPQFSPLGQGGKGGGAEGGEEMSDFFGTVLGHVL